LPTNKKTKGVDSQVVTIPDEAIAYIVNAYLEEKTKTSGVNVVVGISTDSVIQVMGHFLNWAAMNNYVKDGMLIIGGTKVD
jgi:hypothetical protein